MCNSEKFQKDLLEELGSMAFSDFAFTDPTHTRGKKERILKFDPWQCTHDISEWLKSSWNVLLLSRTKY